MFFVNIWKKKIELFVSFNIFGEKKIGKYFFIKDHNKSILKAQGGKLYGVINQKNDILKKNINNKISE